MNDTLKATVQEWVILYGDDLFRWALHKTNNRETAEDLVQETYLAAFRGIDQFQGKSKPKTWLFSILNNKLADFHRSQFRNIIVNQSQLTKNEREDNFLNNFFDKEGSWKSSARPTGWNDLEVHLLDDPGFSEVLENCMKKLPQNWFSVIHFKYLEEKDGKEICQELGITSSNLWQILHRAKLQLRMCIEKSWFKS